MLDLNATPEQVALHQFAHQPLPAMVLTISAGPADEVKGPKLHELLCAAANTLIRRNSSQSAAAKLTSVVTLPQER